MSTEFDPVEFVGRSPRGGRRRIRATLGTVLADDVVLRGPVLPRTQGLAAARRTLPPG